jgi:hypothetical protein
LVCPKKQAKKRQKSSILIHFQAIFPRFWPHFAPKTLFLGRFACANLSVSF